MMIWKENKRRVCTEQCTWTWVEEPMTSGFFPVRTCDILFSFTSLYLSRLLLPRCRVYCWNGFKCLWATIFFPFRIKTISFFFFEEKSSKKNNRTELKVEIEMLLRLFSLFLFLSLHIVKTFCGCGCCCSRCHLKSFVFFHIIECKSFAHSVIIVVAIYNENEEEKKANNE